MCENSENSEKCYICIDEKAAIIKLNCGCKIYSHKECLQSWFNKKSICLICKQEIISNVFLYEFNSFLKNFFNIMLKVYSFFKLNNYMPILINSLFKLSIVQVLVYSFYISTLLTISLLIFFPWTVIYISSYTVYLTFKNILVWFRNEIQRDVDKYFED